MDKRLLQILFISVIAFLLVGCGFEETKEYEILTIRRYAEVEESGTFTTKKETIWYIEYTYKKDDCIEKMCGEESMTRLKIGEENKVVFEEGSLFEDVYITMEKYKELYDVVEVGGMNDL